ncbi:MAG: amidohydrolase family protein [Pseudonocardia sp.]|uniref:amidohydrolase family protein n=1 Tax=unclassified Pseudonocardia TaxID=2619320 RepID=UPI001AC7FFE5|nr:MULTISPECIES: amidohydrolase family protein [unclassified Pseudonocardia]MBN9112444.1 amidohydrolase family protein [Pseudonocardia sp.]
MSTAITPQLHAAEPLPFFGRAIDIDTHEMIPFHMWPEYYGQQVADRLKGLENNRFFNDNGGNTIVRPDITSDSTEISPETVWNTKGVAAPGAFDMRRRCEVLDAMGVSRSLLFPGFGLTALLMRTAPEWVAAAMDLGMDAAGTRELGIMALDASNQLMVDKIVGLDAARVRKVVVLPTENLDDMMRDMTRFLEQGARAVWVPSGMPPAGTSPADRRLDDFWRLAADNDVPVLLHIGTDFTFPASGNWPANVPAFVPPQASAEFVISPYAGATLSFAIENFLATMVLGGVFERVPHLRFGAVELGAQWLGSFAERLDLWAKIYPGALKGVLSMTPSEYLARNVRVTPFHFEPVDVYLERYPELVSCYSYSSDYPHVEGGTDTMRKLYSKVAPLGDDVVEKFFVENGAWLTPGA